MLSPETYEAYMAMYDSTPGQATMKRKNPTPKSYGKKIDSLLVQAAERRDQGVQKYRDGDESAKFVGDPLELALTRAIDTFVLVKEAYELGKLTDEECDDACGFALDMFTTLTAAIGRRDCEAGKNATAED